MPHLQGNSAISKDIFACHTWGVLLASSESRPEILLNLPTGTGQPPTKQNYLTQNVNSATAEKPALDHAPGKGSDPNPPCPKTSTPLSRSSLTWQNRPTFQ